MLEAQIARAVLPLAKALTERIRAALSEEAQKWMNILLKEVGVGLYHTLMGLSAAEKKRIEADPLLQAALKLISPWRADALPCRRKPEPPRRPSWPIMEAFCKTNWKPWVDELARPASPGGPSGPVPGESPERRGRPASHTLIPSRLPFPTAGPDDRGTAVRYNGK